MPNSLLEIMRKKVVLLDGAMGTELMKKGLSQGMCPELWNDERKDIIRSVHKSYYEAGADAVLTNSFGGSRIKLSSYGLDKKCYELNRKAAEIAADVRPEGRFIGGSMGPTGHFLKPQGTYTEEDFEESFFEQAKGLADGGIDFFLIETQYDLREAQCAFNAVQRAGDKPIFVTMTFNNTPRGFYTLMGNSIEDFIAGYQKKDITGVGANCTLDSRDMVALVKDMHLKTDLPLLIQANAGQPEIVDSGQVEYSQGIEDYLQFIPAIIQNGANIIGGCCGTDPAYIRRMAQMIDPQSA